MISSALTVTTFADFERYAEGFARKRIANLLIVGDPGCSKSQTVRRAIKGKVCWIEGQASAVGMYETLYRHRHWPVVIDDVDELYAKSNTRRLLKSLCQTDAVKELAWNTQNRTLEMDKIPKSFTTKSPVCIIANQWETLNSDVAAIQDRAITLLFKPTPLEIHLHAARWFKDQEVFDFMASILHIVVTPSLRHYIIGHSLRKTTADWRERLIERVCEPEIRVVAQSKLNPTMMTEEERAKAFVAAGHGHRSTYFRGLKKLPDPVDPPQIKLKKDAKSQRTRNTIPIRRAN